jgi:mRNA-degrading endonuclease RelE of RelBE toxin-antitoxin system
VRLTRVEGLELYVSGLDLLDGTPLLDLKPYVPYTDAIPSANHGWLSQAEGAASDPARPADPIADYEVSYEALALSQLAFLSQVHQVDLKPRLEAALRLGPSPHAYRRIRKEGDFYRLAVRDWRVRFSVSGRAIAVLEIKSGYRPRELFTPEGQAPQAHRDFVSRWPTAIDP